MIVRVDELAILLVIFNSGINIIIYYAQYPLATCLMVGWYLCWGPEIARIVVGTLVKRQPFRAQGKNTLVKMQQCNLILAQSTIWPRIKSDAQSIMNYYH